MGVYMKKLTMTSVAVLLSFFSFCSEDKSGEAMKLTKKAMKETMPPLVKKVSSKVSEEGVAAAVDYCHSFAPEYGRTKNRQFGSELKEKHNLNHFKFYRRSLRNRNPANYPEGVIKAVMLNWQQKEEKGQKAEPVTVHEKGMYYTLMPIRVNSPLCLNCHGMVGEEIEKITYAKIKEKYPEDKATGYSMGDLRGAFVTEIGF